ncbi:MAG: deiodinase-like protein [Pseudomonadota bacterium]
MRRFALLPLVLCLLTTGCSALFPTEPGPTLAHFAQEAPDVGDVAPSVTVTDLEGNPVALHSLFGARPVVIQLGSYTCPVFRYRRFDMQPMRERYKGDVDFVVLYTTEAHPVGSISPYADREWVPWHNRLTRVRNRQPESLPARVEQATIARTQMHSNARFLVDDMGNDAWRAYGRAPSAAFLVDRAGVIRLRQVWVEPKALTRAIDALLAESSAAASP